MFTEVSCAQNEYASQIQRSRIRYPCRKREVIKDAAAHAVVCRQQLFLRCIAIPLHPRLNSTYNYLIANNISRRAVTDIGRHVV